MRRAVPATGSSYAWPPDAGTLTASVRDTGRGQLGGLRPQRGEVAAAHVVDEAVLEGVQQHEGGDRRASRRTARRRAA